MLIPNVPYFMKNKKWYYHDKKEFKYKLTKEAPQKAIDSYNKYYEQLDKYEGISNKAKEKKNKYYYIKYLDDSGGKAYSYKSKRDYFIDDVVEVMRNSQNTFGKVVDIKFFKREDEPYPYEKLNNIIRKVDLVELRSDDDWKNAELSDYRKLVLNNMFGKLQIKRFMNILKHPIKNANLYYYPKFNTFFYKDKTNDIYVHAEYETEIITEEMYRIIVKDSIKVDDCSKVLDDNKLYIFARKFCINNNIDYYDDTDIMEFCEEKQIFNTNKKEYLEPKDYENIDEIIKDLENYKDAVYTTSNPAYYIEDDKIIYFMSFLDYKNRRIFKIPKFLLENNYIDKKYYDRKNYPELFEEEVKNYNFEVLLRKRLSYFILRSFNIERMSEGIINSMCKNGYMLRAVKRLKELGKITDNENVDEEEFYDKDAIMTLTTKNLKTLKYEDVLMMSFAEPGAMGCPGEINFFFKNNRVYKINYSFSNKLSMEDLFELFPPLKNVRFFINNVSNLDEDCDWFNMGYGNYLIVKKRIYNDFKKFIDKEITGEFKEGELYNRWIELARKFNIKK